MTDFPIELWHLIFDHLHLVDLSSCARVSKAVYVAMKAYRIREIAFTGRVYEWFHYSTDQPITDHKYRIDYSLTSILKKSSFDFDFLKRLKIGRSSVIDDIEAINKFTGLEELDLDLKNYKNEKSRTLSLANLKVLYLFLPDPSIQPNGLPYVELDTPCLAKVCTFSLKMIDFFYPGSVRCIHTFFHSGKLSMFPNLEYLAFIDFYNQLDYFLSYNSQSFDLFGVGALKKLKEIDLFYYFYPKYRDNNMSMFKRMIANLLGLGRPNLKVFWYDVQVTDPNLLNEYERAMETVGSVVAFQLQHYDLLKEKVEFFWSYNFNSLVRNLRQAGLNPRSEEVTSKLLAKYSFRRIVITGRVEERELLLELIAGSPDLFALKFENSRLDQSFFHRMTDIVQVKSIPLQKLLFKVTSNELLNFDFVSKLRDLELFETDQELSPGLIAKLLRLPLLVEIKCSYGGTSKRIERLPTSRFRLNGETLSLQELLEHFRKCSRILSQNQPQSQPQNVDSEASKCRLM